MRKIGKQDSVAYSMMLKTMERYVTLAAQFIVQIVIARILEPEAFGLISMMMVFISVANIFIHNGFSTALIQKKDATEDDYSTALIINSLIGVSLYAVLFVCAPWIADFYGQEQLTRTLRVLALILVLGSVTSIQGAIIARNMQFKIGMICHLVSSVASGAIGIIGALAGLGVWALVIQQLSSQIITATILGVMLGWVPKLTFNKKSAGDMFRFGWKMLAAGVFNQIYNELNDLVIGKKYTSDQLAYYSKGKQFPVYITTGVDGSIKSVIFSVLSKQQSDIKAMHRTLKKAVSIEAFLIFPMMMGLAMVAEPLVLFMLTEKWLPVVPYLRICCLTYALNPLASLYLQTIAAIGRSDMRLKLEFIKKPTGILCLIIALQLDKGPFAIACSAVLTSVISFCVDMIASHKVIRFSLRDQMTGVLPAMIMSMAMGSIVFFLGALPLKPFLVLVIQVIAGMLSYFVMALIFKPVGYNYVMTYVNRFLRKFRKR